MSDIKGDGHGSAHEWERDLTDTWDGEKGTRYFCKNCGICFIHLYDVTPNIFEAMENNRIPSECKK